MFKISFLYLSIVLFTTLSCSDDEETDGNHPSDTGNEIGSYSGSVTASFGLLQYRFYFLNDFYDSTYVIHVSRGGNGLGDDRGELYSYVEAYVKAGYVVLQVDHRFAGSNIEKIAQYRGEEISFIAAEVKNNNLNYGNFNGSIDGSKQGYAGHSGGCMEGLMAAGTEMTHGNYHVPQIKAVYGMSPAGYNPDQFGITQNPIGYSQINETAVFVIIGEEEKDINGPGIYMAEDWRLQAFESMTDDGPRFQVLVKGSNTSHLDIAGENNAIKQYNIANSLALFDTYIRGINKREEIGTMSLPGKNEIELSINTFN